MSQLYWQTCFIILFVIIYRYLISVILLWSLMGKVDLLPPSIKHLQFGRFLKNGKTSSRNYCIKMFWLNNCNKRFHPFTYKSKAYIFELIEYVIFVHFTINIV